MSNIDEVGSVFLEAQRHRHRSSPVTYWRGTNCVQVQATLGRTPWEQVDAQGVLVQTESRDYLLRTVDLVLAGVMTLPIAGDRITEVQNGVTYSYEVMSFGGEGPWRYSDAQRQTLRIHTKLVSRA